MFDFSPTTQMPWLQNQGVRWNNAPMNGAAQPMPTGMNQMQGVLQPMQQMQQQMQPQSAYRQLPNPMTGAMGPPSSMPLPGWKPPKKLF